MLEIVCKRNAHQEEFFSKNSIMNRRQQIRVTGLRDLSDANVSCPFSHATPLCSLQKPGEKEIRKISAFQGPNSGHTYNISSGDMTVDSAGMTNLNNLEGVHGGCENGHLIHLTLPSSPLLVSHEPVINCLDRGPCILGIRFTQGLWLRNRDSWDTETPHEDPISSHDYKITGWH